jgi:hypothetical protein
VLYFFLLAFGTLARNYQEAPRMRQDLQVSSGNDLENLNNKVDGQPLSVRVCLLLQEASNNLLLSNIYITTK